MTYCCGILVREGLVMIADTRTNAGLDNVSTFRKLHVFKQPGERKAVLAKILGLEDWQVYEERAKNVLRQIEQEVSLIDLRLDEIEQHRSEVCPYCFFGGPDKSVYGVQPVLDLTGVAKFRP